jgi:hypothetical protein
LRAAEKLELADSDWSDCGAGFEGRGSVDCGQAKTLPVQIRKTMRLSWGIKRILKKFSLSKLDHK